jgi:hypothetical protein
MKIDQQKYRELVRKYTHLSKFIRHKSLNSLNTACLAMEVFRTEIQEDVGVMIASSMDKIINSIFRWHDLESVLQFSDEFDQVEISLLLNTAFKQYSSTSVSFQMEGETNMLLSEVYEKVFSSLLRHAVKIRKATKVNVKIETQIKEYTIIFEDNGDQISKQLIDFLEKNRIFNSEKCSISDLDMFIAKDITQAINTQFIIGKKPPQRVILRRRIE